MNYSEYGTTRAKVSAVGFGGMRFDIEKSDEENAALLRYAFDKGINYFDTAPSYCEDKSEDIFGIAIRDMADLRDKFYVSTKGMPTSNDTADKARAAVEKSMKRLSVDKIDFYHVWCLRKMEHYDLAMKKGGQYEGLLKCKEEGLIDNIVVSSHMPGSDIAALMSKGEFAGVLMGLNILNFMYRWDGVEAANKGNYGVVAMNPLSGGLIPQHEKEFSFLAREGETATEAALRFIISCPQINIALIGFTTKEHIDTACRIADAAEPFTQEDIARVKRNVSENMNSLCTGCGYCRGVCPKDIPVPNYMQYYNDKPLFGKTDKEMVEKLKFEREWGMLVERMGQASDCTGCQKCQDLCTQHLDIIARLAEVAQWSKDIQ